MRVIIERRRAQSLHQFIHCLEDVIYRFQSVKNCYFYTLYTRKSLIMNGAFQFDIKHSVALYLAILLFSKIWPAHSQQWRKSGVTRESKFPRVLSRATSDDV